MANVTPKIVIEIDPRYPVPEICAVIAAVLPYHPGNGTAIMRGVLEAIDQELQKGAETDGVPEPTREPANQ
ncbi:hypothetical protein [Paenibacillus sp. NFR01]|uniref:hypothetical protein n=1 Tax=Paenibacillus sp. NFR01 TaxID=1566279 RepID=UPI0008B82716|nr:hypothetical protein [Paenibacillus sp. NFR01]SEU32805.1 hypothetical protein SAMN03159358_0157 [Paenibacillus sp. NFR01]